LHNKKQKKETSAIARSGALISKILRQKKLMLFLLAEF